MGRQEVPEGTKESIGSPWQFVGLLPLFDPPRHDSAETIRRALNLGVNVKMITGQIFFTCSVKPISYFFDLVTSLKRSSCFCVSGDQLAIAKETGRRLGMGTNMYPSSSLLGQHKDESIASLPVDELIEKADGFAGVFPGTHKPSLLIYCMFLLLAKLMSWRRHRSEMASQKQLDYKEPLKIVEGKHLRHAHVLVHDRQCLVQL